MIIIFQIIKSSRIVNVKQTSFILQSVLGKYSASLRNIDGSTQKSAPEIIHVVAAEGFHPSPTVKDV